MESSNKGRFIGLAVVVIMIVLYLVLRFQSGSGPESNQEQMISQSAESGLETTDEDLLMMTDDNMIDSAIEPGDAAATEASPNYMEPQPPVELSEAQAAQLALGDSSEREAMNLTFDVSGGSFYYVPNVIRVKQGDRVKIVFNNVGGTHDLVLPDFDVRTNVTRTGESDVIEFVADKQGSFEFYCSVGNGYHRDMGQVGTLIVE